LRGQLQPQGRERPSIVSSVSLCHDADMLHVRLIAPTDACDTAIEAVRSDPTTSGLAVVRGAGLDGAGDLVMFDVARENANRILDTLRGLGIAETGTISLEEPLAVLSRAAEAAERAAPGNPADGVVWDQIEDQARTDARLSWSFLIFLTLATLIAGIGRYLDQQILIIGAMVVGPEFAPIFAICFALARRRPVLIRPALVTLFGGLALAAAFSWVVWFVCYQAGIIEYAAATSGQATEFIIRPDGWSFVIAMLAGCAGMLSLTAAKSSALVGVFISITTVPAVGTIALALAVGAWGEAGSSLVQLLVNLAGLVIAGTATLLIQLKIWRPGRAAASA
jgi:uncharacterized hydrophobic protein (TIGR00271 family)